MSANTDGKRHHPPSTLSPPAPGGVGSEGAAAVCQPEAERNRRPGSIFAGTTGGRTERFSGALLRRVAGTLWNLSTDAVEWSDQLGAAFDAMAGFQPRDEVEGMLAAQAVGLHLAAMECLRRAMIPEQPAEAAGRLRQEAVRASRAMAEMAEAIDRRRGSAQQTVRVEHVTVQAGGQAIVGHVEQPRRAEGGGI